MSKSTSEILSGVVNVTMALSTHKMYASKQARIIKVVTATHYVWVLR